MTLTRKNDCGRINLHNNLRETLVCGKNFGTCSASKGEGLSSVNRLSMISYHDNRCLPYSVALSFIPKKKAEELNQGKTIHNKI